MYLRGEILETELPMVEYFIGKLHELNSGRL